MKVAAYGRLEKQRGFAAAVAGLQSFGADVELIDGKGFNDFSAPGCDFAIMEGVRGHHRHFWNAHKKEGAPPIVLIEYGYLARASSPQDDESKTWQLGFNKLGWVPKATCPPDRWRRLGLFAQEWREPLDQPIVVCGDHPGFLDHGNDFIWPQIRHWALTALEKLRRHTNRR
ncbi:MAG: hypothetical protein AAGC77_13265, partial [Pseudomonadota bacterium]